jgi:hypothetical protein
MNRDIPRTNGNGAGFLTAGVLRRALAPRSSARSGPLSPLQLLGLVTALYLAASTLFLTLIGGDVPGLIVSGIASSAVFFTMIEQMMPLWVLPLVVALMAGVVLAAPGLRAHARTRSSEVLAAIILSALFVNAFSMVKTHLPAVIPFWADPMFTRIDTALGLTGSFTWLSDISTLLLLKIYMNGWVFVATFLPAILAAFDADAARRRRFILLWAAAWVVLGNLLAGAFMSAGPIFLDRLDGGTPEAFPTLFALLARPDAAELNAISDFLWTNYSTGQFSVGSGISAFPSVHVGMAVVFCAAACRRKGNAHPVSIRRRGATRQMHALGTGNRASKAPRPDPWSAGTGTPPGNCAGTSSRRRSGNSATSGRTAHRKAPRPCRYWP